MKSKNAKKGSKNDKVKRNVQTMKKAPRRHSREEIISEEELDNRIAIDGDIRLYFTMYLKIFIDGHFRHPKKRKLINLAQYIYDQKVLYIHKHDGYKLMELSSIHAELGALKKPVEEEYMKEKKEKTPAIGIENCRKRLELLYPGRFNLTTVQENRQYKIRLTIRLQ